MTNLDMALSIMIKGMGGIFVALAVVYCYVLILNCLFPGKKRKSRE